MEMRIHFPGNKQVAAELGTHTILTDQPVDNGGADAAPAPFDLFLASLGTCAGIFVLSFCQKRNLPTEGLELIQKMEWDPVKHLMTNVRVEILLPPGFPEKYREPLINAASLCTVKRHLHEPPKFEVVTVQK